MTGLFGSALYVAEVAQREEICAPVQAYSASQNLEILTNRVGGSSLYIESVVNTCSHEHVTLLKISYFHSFHTLVDLWTCVIGIMESSSNLDAWTAISLNSWDSRFKILGIGAFMKNLEN